MFKFILSLSVVSIVLFSSSTVFTNSELVGAEDSTIEEQAAQEKQTLIEELKGKLHSNLTEQEIVNLFGEPDQKLNDDLYGLPSFRYDIHADEQYSLDANYQIVDMEALKNKELEAIIYFDFDDKEKMRSVALYFVNDKQKIEEYRLFADGTEKKQALE